MTTGWQKWIALKLEEAFHCYLYDVSLSLVSVSRQNAGAVSG